VPSRFADFAIGYWLFVERERASGEFARSAAGRPDTRPGDPFFLREEIESHSAEQPFTLRNTNPLLTNEFWSRRFQKEFTVCGSQFTVEARRRPFVRADISPNLAWDAGANREPRTANREPLNATEPLRWFKPERPGFPVGYVLFAGHPRAGSLCSLGIRTEWIGGGPDPY
jgi:hypothetical protein